MKWRGDCYDFASRVCHPIDALGRDDGDGDGDREREAGGMMSVSAARARAVARPRIMPSMWAGRLAAMVIHRACDATAGTPGAALEQDFDALFERCEARIFAYLWRVTGDRHAASDLCQ